MTAMMLTLDAMAGLYVVAAMASAANLYAVVRGERQERTRHLCQALSHAILASGCYLFLVLTGGV